MLAEELKVMPGQTAIAVGEVAVASTTLAGLPVTAPVIRASPP
jgi:hypothetical protein